MVTMAILGVIMVGVIGLVTTQNNAYHSEEGIIDTQMNGRIAINRLVRIIRMAGLGCQGNISKTPYEKDNTTSYNKVITAINNDSGPDELTIISAWRQVGVVANINDADGDGTDTADEVIPRSNSIKISLFSGAPPFTDDGYKKYFFIIPSANMNFLTIDSGGVNGSTLTKKGSKISVTEGDAVQNVRPYTFRIYTDSNNIQCLGYDDGSGIDSLAENIEDFQVQYGWDADKSGSIDSNEWVNDPSGNETDIRAIHIDILARSGQPDRDFTDRHDDDSATAGKQYTLAGHKITLDTNDNNGIHSKYDHHYHRYHTKTTIFLRNMDLLPNK